MLLRELVIAQFTLRPSLSFRKNTFLSSELTFGSCFYVKMINLYYLSKVLLFFKQLSSERQRNTPHLK